MIPRRDEMRQHFIKETAARRRTAHGRGGWEGHRNGKWDRDGKCPGHRTPLAAIAAWGVDRAPAKHSK